jgi:WD40 repeat protein
LIHPVQFAPPPFFIAGGTLRGDAQSYVRRKADDELYEGLLRGEFCYILTARQMGKSSLMVRAGARLQAAGIAVAVLDLTAVGQNVTPEQWYGGLIMQLGYRLGLAQEVMSFWQTELVLGPLQRWLRTVRDVVLRRCDSRHIVIFVDEIDAVRSLPFSADEFFAGIRECYNQRSADPKMERLSFGLLGVAAPTDLIRDTSMTPFNIGRRIELKDFTPQEAVPLALGLSNGNGKGHAVLNRILHWTGGHPYLTQRMCLEITQGSDPLRLREVDGLCSSLFFSHRAQERDDNLLFVRERMLRSEVDQSSLLDLYRRIRKGDAIADDEMNPLITSLQLSGIVRTMDGSLKVRNRIYSRVFDPTWINTVMPHAELRRQKAAFRRGIWRTTLVATLVVALAVAFTFLAFHQGQAQANRRLLYDTNMKLAQEAWDHSYVDRVEELLKATAPQPTQEDLRGFEWYLFQHLAGGDLWRNKQPYRVIASALSENAGILYVTGYEQEANEPNKLFWRVYDLVARREVRTFRVPTDAAFPQVVFSPDRKRAIMTGPEQNIEEWDLISGTKIAVLEGHRKPLATLSLSADGKTLASGDVGGTVKIWDISKMKAIRTMPKQSSWMRSVSLSFDGKLLAVADDSLQVRLWETSTGREVQLLTSRQGAVTRVAFLPNSRHLLAANKNGALQLWDIRGKRVAAIFSGHSGQIESVAFSPDGRFIATGSTDRTAKLWSASTGRELQVIRGHGAQVNSVSFSADGRYLVTGAFDHYVKIWDTASQPDKLRLPNGSQRYLATAFTAGNNLLAVGTDGEGQASIWNLSTGRQSANLDISGDELGCAAFSVDVRLVATGGMKREIKIWDAATGKLVRLFNGHSADIFAVAFSPDGKLLISGGYDRTLRLWDLATGKERAHLKSNLDNSYSAVFSTDGKLIASGTRNGTVQLWDAASLRILRTFSGHSGQVRSIAFSADGKWLATGADDHTLRLWDVATGRLVRTLGLTDVVQRAVFSPDGKRLITGGADGSVRLWDIFSGQELMTLPGHTDEVTSITFSEDGKMLATGSTDGIVRLWLTGSSDGKMHSITGK